MARVRVEVPVETEVAEKHPDTDAPASGEHINGKQQKTSLKKILLVCAGIFVIIFVINLINDRNRLQKELSSNTDSSQKVEDIVAQLSRSVELPVNETPQMRTIEDAGKFTQQNPSLSDIKNGDVLLFFDKSQKVVVYRPSTKKAVVVVTLSQPDTSSSGNGTTNR